MTEAEKNEAARKWVGAFGWVLTLFGAFFFLAAVPALDGGVRLFYALVGYSPGADVFADPATRLSAALIGAVMVGWGVTMTTAARVAAGGSLTRGAVAAVLVWYVIDSAASIAHGFPLNAVSNTAIAALFLGPLLLISRRRSAA